MRLAKLEIAILFVANNCILFLASRQIHSSRSSTFYTELCSMLNVYNFCARSDHCFGKLLGYLPWGSQNTR